MDETNREEKIRRRHNGNFVLGVVLLAVGALLLADNLGFDLPFRLWEAWPLVIVALGAIRLLTADDSDERRNGFWTLAAGLYCWISSWRLFGLQWGSAWPIFLVAQGLVIVFPQAFGRAACRDEVRDAR
jgi:hypothetical protein